MKYINKTAAAKTVHRNKEKLNKRDEPKQQTKVFETPWVADFIVYIEVIAWILGLLLYYKTNQTLKRRENKIFIYILVTFHMNNIVNHRINIPSLSDKVTALEPMKVESCPYSAC